MRFTLDELNTMLYDGWEVYRHYYPLATGKELKEQLGSKILSPFREEERPSFSLFRHSSKGTIFFKDHGIDKVGTHWQFVMDLYSLDFKEAVDKVKQDILGIGSDNPGKIEAILNKIRYEKPLQKSGRVDIKPGYREWIDDDFSLFKKALISPKTLEVFNVRALSHFELLKENKTIRITERNNSPLYAFQINGRFKIYQPKGDPAHKWTSNLIADEDIFGFDLIPKECEHIFLVGGNRDTMSFYENIGYPVISLASESTNLTDSFFTFLKRIAKNIWVLYDADKQGYRKAEKFKEEYGLLSLNHLYEPFNVKDFCQLAESYPSRINEFSYFLSDNINNMNNK